MERELSAAQREYVSEVLSGAQGWVALEGALGSGRAAALHEVFRGASARGWRVLVTSPYAVVLDQMALRLSDAEPGARVEVITKDRFRVLASTGDLGEWSGPGVYLARVGLLGHRDVSTALSQFVWDLVTVEDPLAGADATLGAVEVRDGGVAVRFGEGEPIPSRRVTTVTSDGAAAESRGARLVRLGERAAGPSEVRPDRLDYVRTAEEAHLLSDLDRALAGAGLPAGVPKALQWAASSSLPALSRTLIDLVGSADSASSDWLSPQTPAAVGSTGAEAAAWGVAAAVLPLMVLGPLGVGVAAGGAYALARARRGRGDRDAGRAAVAAFVETALALSDRVDELSSDSKLDRLTAALAGGELGAHTVVFADHPETFDHLALMLGDAVPVHAMGAEDGDAAARQATIEAFGDGGVLLAQTLTMQGLEVSATDLLHYDLFPGGGGRDVREARVRPLGQALRTWQLIPHLA